MRVIALTLLLLFNGSALFAFPGGAMHSEEITAEWESGSESVIQGNRILSDLRNNHESVLKMNAFCSYESLKNISELRDMASSVIIRSQESGVFSGDSYLAGVLLQNIGELSFKSLNAFEQRLVLESEKIFFSSGTFHGRNISSENIPLPEYASAQMNVSLTVSSSSNLKNYKDKNRNRILLLSDRYIICSRDFFETEFADLYRLYLYVKDNSGNRKKTETLYNRPSLCSLQPLYNSTRYKNTLINETSQIDTSIYYSGASL
ncbi:MAG: hypothetical protein CVV49_07275 [Spirochaetae bacterium HGW-Spirochaetae-5]|nr:MAG: hypothetical protein CVV49_07275 [Spirochaetae bacterium HGW-Spirochaetae-5]